MALPESRARLRELIEGPNAVPFSTEKDWENVQDAVLTWFVDLKLEESRDTFNKAFQESRMTIRAIQEGRHGAFEPTSKPKNEYYYEYVTKVRGEKGDEKKDRQVKTMQGVPGIQARMTPDNFRLQGPNIRSLKNDKGLHDVSAGLLNPKRPLRIGGGQKKGEEKPQLHRYSGQALWVFMPVPSEADLTIFYQLTEMSKKPQTTSLGFKACMRVLRSRLTRIKFAFENDAGLTFIDLAPEGEAIGKFRYGYTALKKPSLEQMTPEEIQERKLAARTYKTVLKKDNENEIVLAYRQHGLSSIPSRFPIYAFYNWEEKNPEKRLSVVKAVVDHYEPTGEYISESGRLWS